MKVNIDKKFTKIGSSWGIIIPAWIMKGLDINPATEKMLLTVENDDIIIKKKSEKNL